MFHARTQRGIFFEADRKVTTAGDAGDTLHEMKFGAHKFYWGTGDRWRAGTMKLGVMDGLWTMYHIGGQRSEEGGFDLGRRQGEWNCWYAEWV